MPLTSKRNDPGLQQGSASASELVLLAPGISDLPEKGVLCRGKPLVRGGRSQSHTQRLQALYRCVIVHDSDFIALNSKALGHSSFKSFLYITYLLETSGLINLGSRLL